MNAEAGVPVGDTTLAGIAVVGSRNWPIEVRDEIKARVERDVCAIIAKHPQAFIVSGGAKGVDTWAEEAAVAAGAMVYSFRPARRDNGLYGIDLVERRRGFEESKPCADAKTWRNWGGAAYGRNIKIVQHSQRVVIYQYGESDGTSNTRNIAKSLDVPTWEPLDGVELPKRPVGQHTNYVPLKDRFWDNVEKTEGCWRWTGSIDQGYGTTSIDGRKILAHRASWLLAHGELPPPELEVRHTCDNPSCVRPDHLILGTHRENMHDWFERGGEGPKRFLWQAAR